MRGVTVHKTICQQVSGTQWAAEKSSEWFSKTQNSTSRRALKWLRIGLLQHKLECLQDLTLHNNNVQILANKRGPLHETSQKSTASCLAVSNKKNKKWALMMIKMSCQNTMDSTATITKIVKMRKKISYRMACLKTRLQTMFSRIRAKGIVRIGLFPTIMRKKRVLKIYEKAHKVSQIAYIRSKIQGQ